MSPANKRKWRSSPLFDDQGFPDKQAHFESMVPNVSCGRLIRKRKHPAPDVNSVDPNFGEEFNLATHGPELDQLSLSLSHLTISQQSTLKSLLQKDWRIFSKKGVTVPGLPMQN